MQIESIQLTGFQTFAEPTTVELDQGMTCIVGPNGCGKDSVINAIHWALTENPTDERFKGAEQHPLSTSASVTLNLLEGDLRNRFDRSFNEHGSHFKVNPENISREEIATKIHSLSANDNLPTEPRQILLLDQPESAVAEDEIETVANKLEQLSSIHQLIVVTNSSAIMMRSDKIIGITMQEYGVSCLMNV